MSWLYVLEWDPEMVPFLTLAVGVLLEAEEAVGAARAAPRKGRAESKEYILTTQYPIVLPPTVAE